MTTAQNWGFLALIVSMLFTTLALITQNGGWAVALSCLAALLAVLSGGLSACHAGQCPTNPPHPPCQG